MGGFLGIALIIGVIVMMQRNGGCCGHSQHGSSHHHRTGGKGAVQILEERYARGEIDQDTYRQMKSDLEES